MTEATAQRLAEAIERLADLMERGAEPDERPARLPGVVDLRPPGAGSLDSQDMAVYVAWLYGDGFSPAEPREDDEFGHEVPRPRQSLDDALDVWEREHVAAGGVAWNPRSAHREWKAPYDASALGMAALLHQGGH